MEKTVLETVNNYRAVIVREDYAEAPDGDFQAGVIRLDYGGYYDVDAKTEAAGDFEHPASHFMATYGMNKGIEVFKRFLTIFHGTKDIREFSYSYSPDSAVYLAFDSADMRSTWGCAEDVTDAAEGTATEWQAYIDGDVYGVAVERYVSYTKEWEDGTTEEDGEWFTVEDTDVWGYYGETWAEQAAREALKEVIELEKGE